MCIFTGEVESVSDTHIFCRIEAGMQYCVYEMRLSTPVETAMVLPLPVAPGHGDDALRFIDLSGYPDLFDDLEAMFPAMATLGLDETESGAAAAATLAVHRVGAFEASFVPTMADFDRLDPRFRLAEDVWAALPAARDHGFAVFQLAAGEAQDIHPMAFTFAPRDPGKLVFPTVHVHDGEVHATAEFDHKLFCQLDGVDGRAGAASGHVGGPDEGLAGWEFSAEVAGGTVRIDDTAGIVDAAARCVRRTMIGSYANEDVVIDLAASGGRDASASPR